MVARAEPSSDALLGFELVESGTCWLAITQEILAYRSGSSRAGLWWQMSSHWDSDQPRPQARNVSVRSRRELLSFFQYAFQFVTLFGGRVGRVWASVRPEFHIALALLPFSKCDLSWTVGYELFMPQTRLFPGWELRLSLRRPPWSRVWVKFSGRWRYKGPVRATSKRRGALDEEIGPFDLDLLNLMGLSSPVPWYSYCLS